MPDTASAGMGPPPIPLSRPPQPVGASSDHEFGTSDSEDDDTHGQEAPSPTDSVPSLVPANKNGDGASDSTSVPMQKRRRVTRACDECRRKKIKCDGKQPCTHCQVYSYDCTYDKPSNRRRNPAPQYIEALEDRLIRAENLLRQFMPDVDLTDPNLDPAVQQEFRNRERARALASGAKKEDLKTAPNQDAQILSMIESLGHLDLNEKGAWDFHGTSSGAVFLKKIQEHFPSGMLQTPAYSRPFLPKAQNQPGILTIDSPGSSGNSPWSSVASPTSVLPPRDHVDHLCNLALECATCLIRIVHVPSFYEMIDHIYSIPTETFEIKETRFVALMYAVMALGCLYDVPGDLDSAVQPSNYKIAFEQGIKYYTTARMILQDITECQDLTTLQSLLFMILFLQGTSNLSGCYAFVGVAFRSAITMGLHRHIPHPKMNKIEDHIRRRIFYIIRQMDTYVSAMLGFPMMNIDDAVDQPYPEEFDDRYIRNDGIQKPDVPTPSFMQAFNAHTKLMEILAKIIRYVYPLKRIEQCVMKAGRLNATYMISYKRILEVESELQDWLERLPDFWKPSNDGDSQVVRVRHLLRFAYAHVQMMLYRPFIHYSSPRLAQSKTIDQRAFHCAASAINVSRNIVHIGTEIRKQGVLIGPYWFIMYTELFAILSLVFYALENPDKAGSDEILADATAGRNMISSLSKRSAAAEKVDSLLESLFEKLPEKLGKSKVKATVSKKRSASASKQQGGKTSQPPLTSQPQRRSGETTRSTSVASSGDRPAPMPHRTSVDAVVPSPGGNVPGHMLREPKIRDAGFDAERSSESATANPTSSLYQQTRSFTDQHAQQHHSQRQQPTENTNPVYDTMFSSTDPFAYPNQPLLELAAQQQPRHHSINNIGPHSQDSGVFNMPNTLFDDLEGQLVHIPAYIMETQEGQNGVDLPGQMYDPSEILGLGQTAQNHDQHHQHQRHQHPHSHQQPHLHQHQVHEHQDQNGLQGLYVDSSNMMENWNSNFFQNT